MGFLDKLFGRKKKEETDTGSSMMAQESMSADERQGGEATPSGSDTSGGEAPAGGSDETGQSA